MAGIVFIKIIKCVMENMKDSIILCESIEIIENV